jgi:predicted nucleic acid-binding protein
MMIVAILDTTVMLHLYRKYAPAITWLDSPQSYGITAITWLEVMEGATNKTNQAYSKQLLSQFDIFYPASLDYQWAMRQLEQLQFSHHIGKEDCLIASVAYRLQVPLYTHNLKDMRPMLGELAIKPYE